MPTSQNGWPALESSSPLLRTWTIPAKTGEVKLRLRNGSAGFLICHFLLWLAEVIEPMAGKVLDDWGYAYRVIRGQTTGLSNHAAGCAADANALRHGLGSRGTFAYLVKGVPAATRIRARLLIYTGALRWGGDYVSRADEMHIEVNTSLEKAEKVARRLMKTPRGKRLLAANPGQAEVILS